MKHEHKYDKNGKRICCSLEEKIDLATSPPVLLTSHEEQDDHDHDNHDNHDHSSHNHGSTDDEHNHEDYGKAPAIISFVLLMLGLALDHLIPNEFFEGYIRLAWYIAAYLL